MYKDNELEREVGIKMGTFLLRVGYNLFCIWKMNLHKNFYWLWLLSHGLRFHVKLKIC